jgi:hypothetical protein
MGDIVITFDDWEQVLRAGVSPYRYRAYREAIVKFRYWLRETDNVPNVKDFKRHLDWKQSYLAPDRFAARREALRWYYQEGRKRMKQEKVPSPGKTEPGDVDRGSRANHPLKKEKSPTLPPSSRNQLPETVRKIGDYRVYSMNDVPTDGPRDLGGPEWERALVRRILPGSGFGPESAGGVAAICKSGMDEV